MAWKGARKKVRFKWLAALETVIRNAYQKKIADGAAQLPDGVSLAEAIKADGRSFTVMKREANGGESPVATVEENLTMGEVDEAVLREMGLDRGGLEISWKVAAGAR